MRGVAKGSKRFYEYRQRNVNRTAGSAKTLQKHKRQCCATKSERRRTERLYEEINWGEEHDQVELRKRRRVRPHGRGRNKPPTQPQVPKTGVLHYGENESLGLEKPLIIVSGRRIQPEDSIWSQIEQISPSSFCMHQTSESFRAK